jgi:hypothetical protein
VAVSYRCSMAHSLRARPRLPGPVSADDAELARRVADADAEPRAGTENRHREPARSAEGSTDSLDEL